MAYDITTVYVFCAIEFSKKKKNNQDAGTGRSGSKRKNIGGENRIYAVETENMKKRTKTVQRQQPRQTQFIIPFGKVTIFYLCMYVCVPLCKDYYCSFA